jgi:hypothetical protein
MKIAYFDCFSGVSGDMILGSLVDAGLDPTLLVSELDKLGLDGVTVSFEDTYRKAIKATQARVSTTQTCLPAHTHGDDHLVLHEHTPDTAVSHRRLQDILAILQSGRLHPDDAATATDIFTRLAQAEAHVHGLSAGQDVTLHEVGAVDAIIDIVGAVAGLRLLGIEEVQASPLRCGTGFVSCAHGRYPVPVPGVLALCENIPLVQTDVEAELITPTGAAIITTLANHFGTPPPFRQTAVGYGAGSRDLDEQPNLLRLRLGEVSEVHGNGSSIAGDDDSMWMQTSADNHTDQVIQLEANIDDMNPEVYGYVIDLLLEKGARDVYLTPVLMKKGRPGTLLTALADEGNMEAVCEAILVETTSLGVRYSLKTRRILPRRMTTASTPYGDIRVKTTTAGAHSRFAPEYEDCAMLARLKGVPILSVYKAALAAAEKDAT